MDDLFSILDELTRQSSCAEGRSLERLTEHLCHLLKLTPVNWLTQGSTSGRNEVQILALDQHLPPSRWLLQCIHAETVSVDMIATAVGRGYLDGPHCLLTATTGHISSQARSYATVTSGSCHLPGFVIMLFDGADLWALAKREIAIEELIRRELDRKLVAPFLFSAPQLEAKNV